MNKLPDTPFVRRAWAEVSYDEVDPETGHDLYYIVVKAEVGYHITQNDLRLEFFESEGITAPFCDPEDPYVSTLLDEQIADLREHLETFGIEWPDEVPVSLDVPKIYPRFKYFETRRPA